MEDVGIHTRLDLSKDPAEFLAKAQPTTLTLKHDPSGNGFNYTLEQAGGTLGDGVSPWKPFPESFRAVFPGGWKELAQREGFELPKEFDQP